MTIPSPVSHNPSPIPQDDWPARVDAVWRRAHELTGEALVAAIDALAAERPEGDAQALFERACARDTAGLETAAEPFYRAALATQPGLDPYRRTRAVIQLGSTLRWLGRLDESEQLLVNHLDAHRDEALDLPLHDEARAILALTYAEQGRGKEAAGLALAALAPRLSRYNRSMLACAKRLAPEVWHRERRPAAGKPPELAAGRFLLRPCREQDLDEFVAAVQESVDTIGRWMDWAKPGYSKADALTWLDACAKDWESGSNYPFGIFDRATGAFVGNCTLNHFNRLHGFCNLGYWVRKSCVGQGAASAAALAVARFGFEQLGLTRIEIVIAVGNETSRSVARKCGAVEDGILRNRLLMYGQPVAAHMYSLVPG